MSNLFTELKRRNVFRVGAAYGVAGWLLTEISSVVLPLFGVSENALRIMVVMLAIGFPVALVFAWIYEITPEGVKRAGQVDRDNSITQTTGRKLDLATIGMVVAGIVFVLFERFIWVEPVEPNAGETNTTQTEAPAQPIQPPVAASPDADDDRISVAVLPFVNMSSDPEQEYFSDGISEELLNVLVKLEGLRVPSRTSSFAFKGQNLSIGEIARQLNVANVLEGSVRKAGDQVRITAQLIDVRTDAHLWSETYTRKLDDIFAIQDEIAGAIVAALKLTLGTQSAVGNHATENTVAYNHYLKGRFFWHQRTEASFAMAEQELQQAVNLDPGFARAWAGLADVYVLQPEYGWAPLERAIPLAREATERALALDPDSAQAHTTRAYYRYMFDLDWVGADNEFKQAIALDAGYATAHQWRAEMLNRQRRFDEAIAEASEAVRLDPLSPVKPLVLGNVMFAAGRLEEAEHWFQESLKLAPDWFIALNNLSGVRLQQGRYDEARELAVRAAKDAGFSVSDIEYQLASIDALAGKRPRSEAIELVLASKTAFCSAGDQASWLAALGAYDQALAQLRHCLGQGDPYAAFANVLPAYDPMRNMPEFQAHLKELGLWSEADSDEAMKTK